MANIVNTVLTDFQSRGINVISAQLKNLSSGMKEVVVKTKDTQKALSETYKLVSGPKGGFSGKKLELMSSTTNFAALDAAKAKAEALANKQNQLREIMGASGSELNKVVRGLALMGYRADDTGKYVNELGEDFVPTKENLEKLRKSTIRFNMSLLSVMFAAMAANRVITSFIRSAISSYQKANEDTEGLGKATWHLQAAWEFFKYSLVDALTQSDLFRIIVEWLVQLVQKFNELSPQEKKMIAIGIAIAGITTAIILLLAQIGLAKTGLEGLSIGTGLLGGITTASNKLTAMQKIARIGIGIALMWEGIQLTKEGALEGEVWKELMGMLGTTLAGAVIGGTLFGPVGAGVGALIGLTIGLVIDYIFTSKRTKLQNNIKKEIGLLERETSKQTFGTRVDFGTEINTKFLNEMSYAELDAMNQSVSSARNFSEVLKEVQGSATNSSQEVFTFNDSASQIITMSPDLAKALETSTDKMDKYSEAVSKVNVGNSPTGLIHIIESEKNIIDLQPTFSAGSDLMTDSLNKVSEAVSKQAIEYQKLISQINAYIKKLEDKKKAESSGGGIISKISNTVSRVFGSRAIGGEIGRTGPYMLHEGEFVVPRGSPGSGYGGDTLNTSNYSISLTINAETNDPDEISRVVMQNLSQQLNSKIDSSNN